MCITGPRAIAIPLTERLPLRLVRLGPRKTPEKSLDVRMPLGVPTTLVE